MRFEGMDWYKTGSNPTSSLLLLHFRDSCSDFSLRFTIKVKKKRVK
jgi:hypothetical protein